MYLPLVSEVLTKWGKGKRKEQWLERNKFLAMFQGGPLEVLLLSPLFCTVIPVYRLL